MSSLFDSMTLGHTQLSNRIIMAPMTRSRANSVGMISDLTTEYYVQRASAGLIISEGIYASSMGKGYVNTPGLTNAAHVQQWKKVTDAVHAHGGKIFAQIMECGRISLPEFLPGNVQPLAPSALAAKGQNYTSSGMKNFVEPRALLEHEIWDVVENYRNGTLRAKEAGFDGVELHAASGYLPHQFLSNSANKRPDRYGGSALGRCRFVIETIEAMCSVAGSGFIGIKISPEMAFNGIDETDSKETYSVLISELNRLKIAYLHSMISGQVSFDVHSVLRPLFKNAYIAGGGFDLAKGEAFLKEGRADAIAYGTLFISNPDLPHRFKEKAPLASANSEFFYQGGARGYTDYPSMV
jgi:N-ethylmaleimide reductase